MFVSSSGPTLPTESHVAPQFRPTRLDDVDDDTIACSSKSVSSESDSKGRSRGKSPTDSAGTDKNVTKDTDATSKQHKKTRRLPEDHCMQETTEATDYTTITFETDNPPEPGKRTFESKSQDESLSLTERICSKYTLITCN